MTADALTFDLVERLAAIGVSRGHVSFLHGNDLYDITNTNLGRWLLETQGWGRKQSYKVSAQAEANGTIQ